MRVILVLFFLLTTQWAVSQNEEQRVTLSFQNVPIADVLLEIEKISKYKFFYVEDWIPEKSFTGNYSNVPLSEILDDVFEETLLNYYVLDQKVILTRNNIIYDELPDGFFGEREEVVTERSENNEEFNPVFYPVEQRENNLLVETVYIGKEKRTSRAERFTLSGYIYDLDSGQPISNLAVLVRDKNLGSVTNAEGFYSLNLPAGEHILETNSLGSENLKKRVIIYSDGELNFQLAENFEVLGEIFLRSNPDKNVNSAIAGAENINVREIKNIPLVLGERDIMKVATTLPGISTAGEGAAGFNVRGGKTDQNLILLDDAVLYNPAHFFGIFSAINPFTTGDVNIYKGSIPAEYGGRLSAVFDIRTKDANTQEFTGEASLGPVTSNLALEIPIVKERSGLLLGGRSTYSDWILKSLDEESLKNSKASFYDVVAKYNHRISDNTLLRATGYFSNDIFSITSDSLYNYNNRLFSINVNHRFNERNEGSVIVSNSNYNFNIKYESDFSDNFRTGYVINETEAKLNIKYLPGNSHSFNYGVSGKLYVVNPGEIEPLGTESLVESFSLSRNKGLESALYFSDSYEVNEKLLLDGGIRFSFFAALGEGTQNVYQEGLPRNESSLQEVREYKNNEVIKTYGGPEFRFSARYFLQDDLSAKLSYNNTYQYIHTLSNNTTVSPTDTYQLSNLNIKPQRGNQYAAGLYKNFDNNIYELSLEGYYKRSHNILDYTVGAQLFLNENIETEVLQGEGKSYGAEVLLKKTEGRLNGWLGYTYSRSYIKLDSEHLEEKVNDGDYFPSNYDKPHDFSAVTNYKITKRFSFSANFIYQTGRPVTFPTGKYVQNGAEYVVYSDRNMHRIPDYYRLDLSFNVEGNHKIEKFAHSFWNISVYNVLGRNNPYSVYFVTEAGEVKAYQSSIFSMPVPTITYNFRF